MPLTLGSALGGIGGFLIGGPSGAALGYGMMGGGPGQDAIVGEIQRRLQQPQGYSPQEIQMLQAAMTQQLQQQRDLALGQLRSQATMRGTGETGAYAMQAAQIQSGYADALAQGIADIMAASQAERRQMLMGTMYPAIQASQLRQQQRQNWQQSLGQMASEFAYMQAMRGQQAPAQTLYTTPNPFAYTPAQRPRGTSVSTMPGVMAGGAGSRYGS